MKQRFTFKADNPKHLVDKMDHYIEQGYKKVGKVGKVKFPSDGTLKYIVTMEREVKE